MKEKLFTLLFPSKARRIESLTSQVEGLEKIKSALSERLQEQPEPNLADLMRDNMALLPHSFTSTDDPVNPFEGLNRETYEVKVHEINQVFHNGAFGELLEYLTNQQFHYTMTKATNDAQIYAGRFNINGLALVKTNLNKYHNIYEEAIKPPDSFDEHEIINQLN